MADLVSNEMLSIEGLPAIAEALQTSVDTVKRRLRDNKLPELKKETVNNRQTWVLSSADISAVATREGWASIDLRTVHAPSSAQDEVDIVRRYIEAKDRELQAIELAASAKAAETKAQVKLRESQESTKREAAKVRQLTGDLERSNTELAQMETRFSEERIRSEVADALAAERQTLIGTQQTELAELKRTLGDAQSATDRQQQQTQAAEASLGWLARRRYQKRSQQ